MSSPRRYTPQDPCPICGGHPHLPEGQGRRCAGYHSHDGRFPRCTREERAGGLPLDTKTVPPAYVHRLGGTCPCGVVHADLPVMVASTVSGPVATLDDWTPLMPVPDYAPAPTFWRKNGGVVDGEPHPYRDRHGRILYYRVRLKKPGGGKEVKPYAFCEGPDGQQKWVWKAPPKGRRQVYNQHLLAAHPDALVLAVEGEKAAEAAAALIPSYVAITWDGGAGGVAHVDWRSIAGRILVLWPDADRPDDRYPAGVGLHAMRAVAAHALAAGAVEVRLVELPTGLAAHYDSWDLADLDSAEKTPPWMTAELVAELIAEAPVFQPACPATGPAADVNDGPPASGAPTPMRRDYNKNLPESAAAETLAGELGQRFRFHFGTDRWYGYESAHGTWMPVSKAIVHAAVASAIDTSGVAPNGYGERYVTSIMGLLRGRLGIEAWSSGIGFANGVLINGSLAPHSPENLLLTVLPYPYDPAATCDPVIAWLTDTMGGNAELVHILRCALNAILNGRADIQVFLELLGPGGAGKGTFMRLGFSLVGKHASVATELKRLEESRFEPARLRDKLLIQINDSDKYGGDVSMLKRITGGDDIPYEEKGKQSPGDFRATGFVVVTCNEPIRSSDYTSGLARRRITIRFDRQIDMGHARDLEAEFAPYLSGVYNWANELPPAQVARDLREASTRVAAIASLREEIEQSTNPIAAWALAKLYYLPGGRAKVGSAKKIPARAGLGRMSTLMDGGDRPAYYVDSDRLLYASFCEWCEGAGVQAVAHTRFKTNLVDLLAHQFMLPGVYAKTTNQGSHVFGVTLSDEIVDGVRPVPLSEAREQRRRSVRDVSDARQDHAPEDSRPVPPGEGREEGEGQRATPHAAQMLKGLGGHGDGGIDGTTAGAPSRSPRTPSTLEPEHREGPVLQPSLPTDKVVEPHAAEGRRGAKVWELPLMAGDFEEGDA